MTESFYKVYIFYNLQEIIIWNKKKVFIDRKSTQQFWTGKFQGVPAKISCEF